MDSAPMYDVLRSHATATGMFEQTSTHEPKRGPGNAFAIWMDRLGPCKRISGLSDSAALIIFKARIYQDMLREPQDSIDPDMQAAIDGYMTVVSADFTLGGTVFAVDLLGMGGGPAFGSQAGHLNIGGTFYRVSDITVPVLVDNVWHQAE